MDKTVKIRPYADDEKGGAAKSNLTEDQNKSLELAKKSAQLEEERKQSLEQLKIIEQLRETLKQERAKAAELAKKTDAPDANALAVKEAQLEEEKSRSLENLKTIVQLRESLKQAQAKTAEMVKMMSEQEVRMKESGKTTADELASKNAQLEEEKKQSLEQLKIIEQLRENLREEQAKTAEAAGKAAEQEAKAKETDALEARVRELTDALDKIAAIAAVGKTD